jgi:DNA-binding CsgD family transcriptional regulator
VGDFNAMSLSPATERALELCYEAITWPNRWTAALDDLAHAMGARACLILPHDVNDRQYGVVGSSETQKLHELWQRNLDWVKPVYEPRGDPYVRRGVEAVTMAQLFTDEEVRQSRFHQEIARPAGLLQWASGIFSAEGRDWCLPFFRAAEPFAPATCDTMAEVSRRVARIVALSEKISRSSAESEIRTLDGIGCAALLIDRHGLVRSANRGAEDFFCSEFGIRHGRLWTASSASLARLDRFMVEIEFCRSNNLPFPAPVVVARSGIPWLLVEAMPVSSASLEIFDGSRAIVVISDLTRTSITDTALLSMVFGLTNAEARLTAALCEGLDLYAVAANFGISRQTVRGQLKSVFAKTGARRQAELVARAAHIRNIVRH